MPNQTFELKPEHIKLLKAAEWRWEDCEFGAPAIDCKRPYGNSDVITDMLEILCSRDSIKKCPHCREVIEIEGGPDDDQLMALHKELLQALRVIFNSGSMVPGTYENRSGSWFKVMG